MKKKIEWKKTHEFLQCENSAAYRHRPYIPEGSMIMDSRFVQIKPVPRFDFLAHVEIQWFCWTDYELTEGQPNLKQLVRSPAQPRSGETQYAHVIGTKEICSGVFHEGWSQQDYWGEWDCESSSFEQHSRYYVYEVRHDMNHPSAYVLPEDMKLLAPVENSLDLYLKKIRKELNK